MADGVTPDKLYPISFKRATASLDRIKNDVKLWFDDTSAAMQALVSGDVHCASLPNGRILQAKAQGAKVDFEYGQSFVRRSFLVVPKGAPHKLLAMKLIAFASQAEPSAAMMKLIPYATPNRDALVQLEPSYAASMPTAPANAEREVPIDGAFYGETAPNGQSWQQIGLKAWNEWYGR